MTAFSWTCPFCQRPVTVRTETDVSIGRNRLDIDNKDGLRVAISKFIVCPNPECKKVSFDVELHSGYFGGILVHTWNKI